MVVFATQTLSSPFGLPPVRSGAELKWLTANSSDRVSMRFAVRSTLRLVIPAVHAVNREKLIARTFMQKNLVMMLSPKQGPPRVLFPVVPLELVLLMLPGGAGSPMKMNMVSTTVSMTVTMTQTLWASFRKVAPVLVKLGRLVVIAASRTRVTTSGFMTELMLPNDRVRPSCTDLRPLLLSPATQGP